MVIKPIPFARGLIPLQHSFRALTYTESIDALRLEHGKSVLRVLNHDELVWWPLNTSVVL